MFVRHGSAIVAFAVAVIPAIGSARSVAPLPAATDAPVCDPLTGETADAVFRAARVKWDDAVSPDELRYVVHLSYSDDGRARDLHYRGYAEPSEGKFSVAQFSREYLEGPAYVPHGINFFVQSHKVSKEPASDPLGVPDLSPYYSFGLAHAAPVRKPEAAEPANGLHAIGHVTVVDRAYDVTCVDSVLAGTARIDHLRLVPLRAPNDNRLRELWIESGTHWTQRAVIARNFTDGPSLHSAWSIDFAHDADSEYVATERALAPLDFGADRVYAGVTIAFESDPDPPRGAAASFVFRAQDPNLDRVLREP